MSDTDRSRNKSSDLWIESHQKLGQHPKMKRCARMLGIPWVQMVGHLQYLWWWALDFATDGNLLDYDEQDVADAAMWEGAAGAFYEALVTCLWIEQTGDGDVLHDWHDYAGKLLEGREKTAERQRRWREKHQQSRNGNEPANDDVYNRKEPSHNDNVTVMSPPHNVLTVTNTVTVDPPITPLPPATETALPSEGVSTVVDNVTPAFEAAWTAYPDRRGRKQNKPRALTAFRNVKPRDWDDLMVAIGNLAASDQGKRGVVEDMHRFLAHWRDWLEPEKPAKVVAYSNGHAPTPISRARLTPEQESKLVDATTPRRPESRQRPASQSP